MKAALILLFVALAAAASEFTSDPADPDPFERRAEHNKRVARERRQADAGSAEVVPRDPHCRPSCHKRDHKDIDERAADTAEGVAAGPFRMPRA
jgi:hypothetical protein